MEKRLSLKKLYFHHQGTGIGKCLAFGGSIFKGSEATRWNGSHASSGKLPVCGTLIAEKNLGPIMARMIACLPRERLVLDRSRAWHNCALYWWILQKLEKIQFP